MNIDVSSDTFRTQLNDAVILLRSFSQSNSLSITAAISIIMTAASQEGGFDAVITMERLAKAMAVDIGNSPSKSRQQRRWESKHTSKHVLGSMLQDQFPDIFTFNPLQVSEPDD